MINTSKDATSDNENDSHQIIAGIINEVFQNIKKPEQENICKKQNSSCKKTSLSSMKTDISSRNDGNSSKTDANTQDMSLKDINCDLDNEILFTSSTSRERTKIPLRKKGNLSPDISTNNLISKYNMKLKQLMIMKKELVQKQKPMIQLYKTILSLRKQIIDTEGKELPIEEIKILKYPFEDKLCQSKGDSEENVGAGSESLMIRNKMQHILHFFLEICHKVTTEKCKIFDKLCCEDKEPNESEVAEKIDQCRDDVMRLERYTEDQLRKAENSVKMLLDDAQLLLMYGSCNVSTAQELDMKLENSERRLKEALGYLQSQKGNRITESEKVREKESDIENLNLKLKEMHKILREEKLFVQQFKERKLWYEQNLQRTRDKVRSARLKKQELESKVGQLNNYIKKKEEQWKLRKSELEMRYDELKKTFEMQEIYITKLEKAGRVRNPKLLFNIVLHIMYDVLYPELYFLCK